VAPRRGLKDGYRRLVDISRPIVLPSHVQASLLPDEEVLWSGKPDPSALLTKRDAFFIPLSILWAGFAVFWEWSVVALGAPVLFTIWGIPFVAFGLYIVAGRFLVRRRYLENCLYVLTTRRALVATPKKVIAEPATSGPSQLSVTPDNSRASVLYGARPNDLFQLMLWRNLLQGGGGDGVSFENVRDVQPLLDAIRVAAADRR